MSVDPLAALRTALLADPLLTAAIGTEVYCDVMPGSAVSGGALPAHPGLLLRQAGGPGGPRHLPLLAVRLDVHAYGPTAYTASLVHYAAHDALRRIERVTVGGTLLHSLLQEGGAISLVDAATEWPEVVSTWALMAAEEVPA